MRNETVADGIKRRMAEQFQARRTRMNTAVQIAIWSGVIGFLVMIMSVAASYGFH